MNEDQLLHYDLLKIEIILLSTLVHWFFAKLWAIKRGPMLWNVVWKLITTKQLLGVAKWATTIIKLGMQVLCYEVHNH